jgi:hypothetical protein
MIFASMTALRLAVDRTASLSSPNIFGRADPDLLQGVEMSSSTYVDVGGPQISGPTPSPSISSSPSRDRRRRCRQAHLPSSPSINFLSDEPESTARKLVSNCNSINIAD